MSSQAIGMPPLSVTALLRVEGLVAFVAAVTAYWFLGGNWWIFAALLLVPDLSMLGMAAGAVAGSRIYNVAHTYTLPSLLGVIGWFGGIAWLVPMALIWVAHIGMDRALGYGLKYPGSFKSTHLGRIGKHGKDDQLASSG